MKNILIAFKFDMPHEINLMRDYFLLPFNIALLIVDSNVINKLDKSINMFCNEMLHEKCNLSNYDVFDFIENLDIQNSSENELTTFYLVGINTENSNDILLSNFIFKKFLGLFSKDDKILVDITNVPHILALFVFYHIISLSEKGFNINVIFHDAREDLYLPTRLLDNASQTVLDIIADGFSTISQIRTEYSNRKSTSLVSQPFISKIISQLQKNKLVNVSWESGLKHITLTKLGKFLTNSSLFISKKNLLIDFIIKNYDSDMIDEYLEKLFSMDLKETDFIKLLDSNISKKIKYEIFKLALSKFPQSIEIQIRYAEHLYLDNKLDEAYKICSKIIEINPDESRAYELLGKISIG